MKKPQDETDIEHLGEISNTLVEHLLRQELSVGEVMLVLTMAHVTVWHNTHRTQNDSITKELGRYKRAFKSVKDLLDYSDTHTIPFPKPGFNA